jgi:hypothetical protein
MLRSGVFGSNVFAARGDFILWRAPLILGYESLGRTRPTSSLRTDGDVSGAWRRALERTGIGSGDASFADKETL